MSYHVMAEIAKKRLSRAIDAACNNELAAHREKFTPKPDINIRHTDLLGYMQNLSPILQDIMRQQQVQNQFNCYNHPYIQGYQSLGQALFGGIF